MKNISYENLNKKFLPALKSLSKDSKEDSIALFRLGLESNEPNQKIPYNSLYLAFPGRLIDRGIIESLISVQASGNTTGLMPLIEKFKGEIRFVFLNEPETNSLKQYFLNKLNAIKKLKD